MPTPSRLLTRGSGRNRNVSLRSSARRPSAACCCWSPRRRHSVWANSPWSAAYKADSGFSFGPESLHLHLSVSSWAADGLLAIFFFVVGLELKREFVAGDLRDPARAALPIAAAVGGMVVPAAVFIGINLAAGHPENIDGWAVPIATDIAFALAVLAVLSTHLPTALRTFLLTLAVVDDLLAITVIAIFFTDDLSLGPLALALIPIGLFTLAVQRGVHHWWLLARLPWPRGRWCMPAGCTPPSRASFSDSPCRCSAGWGARPPNSSNTPCGRCPRVSRCPVFAFFAAGVTVGGWSGLGASLLHPDHRRRDRRPGDRQTLRCIRHGIPLGQIHPRQPWTTTLRGATYSACRCSPGSASQFRY